jgi:hypothetical protein
VVHETIEPFVGLASQHNVAIVLVHNLNPDPADPYDAFSDSSGLTAAVEGILLLTRERGQADGYLCGRCARQNLQRSQEDHVGDVYGWAALFYW